MDYSKINKFDDIYVQTKNLTKKQKGDFFEEFTYYMFKSDPKRNNGLENIWLYSDVPRKIIKELCLPTKDKGIDLLAKINGDYYAIQCKFRQNSNTILSWTELSTFFGLAFGMNNKIKGGFLVTNTTDLCKEVIRSTKVEPIYGDYFDDLPKNFFKCFKKSSPTYIQKFPFSYQSKCKLSCLVHFVDHNRGHIEMACGSGKTLTSYWIDAGLSNKRTVIFVPSLYLLSQFYSDWVNQSYAENKKIRYLLVGSDADVDEDVKYKSNGLILYTDPKSIKKIIKGTKEKLVVISTYQSSDKLAEACDNFDFGIFDESHKTVGQASKKFTMMLTNKHMTITKRLFMTATPKMYSGDLDDEKIISMDNEKFYGPKIYVYNTGNAIRDKKLVDYQVVSIYAKNASIEKLIKKNRLVKFKKEFDEIEANYLATILVLLKKIKDGTCRHMITYHNKVESARKFSEFLQVVHDALYDDKLFVEHLSGATSMGERNRIIKEFIKSPVSVLCSARVLNEGVNIPIVDSVCFVDARFSTIDIVQCIGRSLRLFNGKTMAHVIVPTFIKDFNEELDKNAYGNVIRILKALKTTDDGVVEYFKMRKNGKKHGRQIVAGEYFDVEVYAKEIDLDKWYDVIDEKVWQMVDGFEYMYEKVKKWVEENGRIPSGTSKNKIEKQLGIFCCHMRQNKKKGLLSEKKILKLEAIFNWYWCDEITIKKFTFDENYYKLTKWIIRNDKLPSKYSNNSYEKKLGNFCVNIRNIYKRKKLNLEKISKLNKLPYWYWGKKEDFIEITYNKIKDWVYNNQKIPSTSSNDPLEKKLGILCSNIRTKEKKNILTKEQKLKFNKINGWFWILNKNTTKKSFDENYNELIGWVNNNKKIPSYGSKNLLEKRFGKLCSRYRENYKLGKVNKKIKKKMDKIPGWYWSSNVIKKRETFNDKFLRLKNWIQINKKIPSKESNDLTEKNLGNFCSLARKNHKHKKLSEDKIQKFNKLQGWYWIKKDTFNVKCIELKKWIKTNNKNPSQHSKNEIEKKLGSFCSHMRQNKKKGRLNKEKIEKLEKIKGWYWFMNQKNYCGSKTEKILR
jgi:superfamily II DNA or RNA helicase